MWALHVAPHVCVGVGPGAPASFHSPEPRMLTATDILVSKRLVDESIRLLIDRK